MTSSATNQGNSSGVTIYPLRDVARYEQSQGMTYMVMKVCGHRVWAGFRRGPKRRCPACPIRPEVRAEALAMTAALARSDPGR